MSELTRLADEARRKISGQRNEYPPPLYEGTVYYNISKIELAVIVEDPGGRPSWTARLYTASLYPTSEFNEIVNIDYISTVGTDSQIFPQEPSRFNEFSTIIESRGAPPFTVRMLSEGGLTYLEISN